MKVLEIAIGLVLIYFLYSLLASIIAEIISTWIGMRARMLKQGIENILNDIKPGSRKDFVRWLKDIFLIEDKNFQYSNGGKFYDEPTIKYLSKPGEHKWYSLRNRKPSYISNENFMITILNMLSGKGRGISEWDKIKFAIETNALHFDPETHKMFMDFVKRSDDQFKQFVNLLQNQFSDTMDRINGWYKRKIGLIIFYIGLVMAIGFNVDTIQIVKILSNDSEKRIEMVQLAEEVIDKKAGVDTLLNRKETIDELKYKLEAHGIVKDAVLKANSIVALGWEFPYDTTHIRKGKYEKLFIDINSINTKISKKEKDLEIIVKDSLKNTMQTIASLNAELDTMFSILSDSMGMKNRVISVNDSNAKSNEVIVHYEKSNFSKALYITGQFIRFWELKFWGILITAIALSLGAQFWFDLLKKLVALRGAGIKPEENEEKKKQLEKLKLTGDTITSKDPVEIAISENRGYWESLPGFIGVNKVINKGLPEIELTYEDPPQIHSPVTVKVKIQNEEKEYKINVFTIKSVKGTFQNNDEVKKGMIRQDSTTALGTVAGLVRNIRTGQRALLTCGHVARTDYSNFIDRQKDSISIAKETNGKWQEIGRVTNVLMSSYVDGALVDINTELDISEFNFKEIKSFKRITKLHEDKLNVKIHTLSGEKAGVIERIDKNHAFDDKYTGDVKFFDLIQIRATSGYSTKLTESGDSGSLITDEEGTPIGVLVGATFYDKEHYSYGIKMKDLLEILQAQTI